MRSTHIVLSTIVAAALLVAGCGPSGATAEAAGEGDIASLPAGKAVDLASSSVAGKVTIYDFYADWCQPCRIITPKLEELVRRNPDRIALRKVDVINFDSEAARHQEIDYLPYLAVVAADGTVAAQGDNSWDYVKNEFGLDLLAELRLGIM